jgi:hypothetical protein
MGRRIHTGEETKIVNNTHTNSEIAMEYHAYHESACRNLRKREYIKSSVTKAHILLDILRRRGLLKVTQEKD